MSSMNTAASAADTQLLQRQLVDPRLGLAGPDECRVDDHVEDLIDRQLGAPALLPLPDVVRADRESVAALAQLAHVVDQVLVGMQMLEVALAEPGERHVSSELLGQLSRERAEERLLGHPTGFQLEQRVCPVANRDGRHRLAELLERDSGGILERDERVEHRRCQDAAEIADDRFDAAHVPRTSR